MEPNIPTKIIDDYGTVYHYLLSVLESVQIHPGHTHWSGQKNFQILKVSVGKDTKLYHLGKLKIYVQVKLTSF